MKVLFVLFTDFKNTNNEKYASFSQDWVNFNVASCSKGADWVMVWLIFTNESCNHDENTLVYIENNFGLYTDVDAYAIFCLLVGFFDITYSVHIYTSIKLLYSLYPLYLSNKIYTYTSYTGTCVFPLGCTFTVHLFTGGKIPH